MLVPPFAVQSSLADSSLPGLGWINTPFFENARLGMELHVFAENMLQFDLLDRQQRAQVVSAQSGNQ